MKVYTVAIIGWWAETHYRVKAHSLIAQVDGVPIEPRLILRLEDDTTIIIRKIMKKDYKILPDFYAKEEDECQQITDSQKRNTEEASEEDLTVTEEPLLLKSTEAPTKSGKTSPEEENPSLMLSEIITRIWPEQ